MSMLHLRTAHVDCAQADWIAISTRPWIDAFYSLKCIRPLSQGLCHSSLLGTQYIFVTWMNKKLLPALQPLGTHESWERTANRACSEEPCWDVSTRQIAPGLHLDTHLLCIPKSFTDIWKNLLQIKVGTHLQFSSPWMLLCELDQGVNKLLLEGPDHKYFRLCRQRGKIKTII